MKKEQKIKLVIFDFDGCIANVEQIVKEVSAELIPKYVKEDINVEKVVREEGMAALIKKSGISYWRVPRLIRKFRKKMGGKFYTVKPYKDMPQLLDELSKTYVVGIATSNSKANANGFLRRYKLNKNFTFVKTNISLFTKSWWLRLLIKKHGSKRSETVMIGDEVRDIEAAKSIGAKSIAVTWGLNTKNLLKKYKPDEVVDTPLDILRILEKFNQ